MGNRATLQPFDSTQSREEAKKNGHKGGIESGKIKREKRDLKQKLEIAIDILTKKGLEDIKDETSKSLLEETGILIFNLMSIMTDKKTKKETKAKVIDMVMDRLYGKPKQTIDNKNNNYNSNIDLTNVSTENLEIISKASPENLEIIFKAPPEQLDLLLKPKK